MQEITIRHFTSGITEPDLPGLFNIWDLSDLLHGKDMVQKLHRHNFYFILILEEGRGTHIIDFTAYPVTDLSIHLMRPGQVHELRLQSGCKGYLLEFTDAFCRNYDAATKQVVKRIRHINYYQTSSNTFSKINSLLKGMLMETSEKNEKYEYAVQTYLQLFFLEILRLGDALPGIQDKKIPYQLELVDVFRELIDENLYNHKQPSWYAEKMNLTTHQLNTIIKTTLGKSSSELIKDCTVLEAKRYLLATTNLVNQISWHLGFEDVSYFIRFFKKCTGYSPEAFRAQYK